MWGKDFIACGIFHFDALWPSNGAKMLYAGLVYGILWTEVGLADFFFSILKFKFVVILILFLYKTLLWSKFFKLKISWNRSSGSSVLFLSRFPRECTCNFHFHATLLLHPGKWMWYFYELQTRRRRIWHMFTVIKWWAGGCSTGGSGKCFCLQTC